MRGGLRSRRPQITAGQSSSRSQNCTALYKKMQVGLLVFMASQLSFISLVGHFSTSHFNVVFTWF